MNARARARAGEDTCNGGATVSTKVGRAFDVIRATTPRARCRARGHAATRGAGWRTTATHRLARAVAPAHLLLLLLLPLLVMALQHSEQLLLRVGLRRGRGARATSA